ncbi:MAG TPA: phosphoenolpyruvate--protein phosphotransferase [Caulobacterales bacterium]|nr:phosphoenolpyruvate--protein phosphotransferase [Caulobacterales bacterium]
MEKLTLVAPVEGWVAPLEEAPDPVFAERMLGDGVLIDPVGSTLHAPCAGEIVSIHDSKHAVTLRCDGGAEVLMHVGIDTVSLRGEGFQAHARAGQRVAAGDKLVSFDLDLLARKAKSLVTPVLVTNGESYAILDRLQGKTARVGDALMQLRVGAGAVVGSAAAANGPEARRSLIMPLVLGLHARPAARVAECARGFKAEIAIHAFTRQSSARSPVGLLSMGLRGGDEITVVARGPDAVAAADAVAALIASGMGEAVVGPRVEAPPTPAAPISGPRTLQGVTASPGMAIGRVVHLRSEEIASEEKGRGFEAERIALGEAVARVRERMETRAKTAPDAMRGILRAHLAFIDDPELSASAHNNLVAGLSAAAAWRDAIGGFIEALRSLSNRRMAERIDDLVDIERQVLRALAGEDEEAIALPSGAIIVASEILPSQLIRLDADRIVGLCTARGGPTSHVAILAAAMGLPALVAMGDELLAAPNGATAILDADARTLSVLPDAAALEHAQLSLARRQEKFAEARAASAEECRMTDGGRIEIFANLGAVNEAMAAVENGAEGCGLLRTEFLFLDRDTPPDEDEQVRAYQSIASALQGRPLIIRTLDIGGDKAAPYLPIPAEENPALGLRGVRVSLWRPHLLRAQLNAILRVTPAGQCGIMAPMIADVAELRAVRAMLEECKAALKIDTPIQLGVMIETPAAAATADLIAAEADFLSIGTNDLTQYALAMDRGNVELAARIDALHPAVLRLIAQTAEGARLHKRWLGVCGGLAGDLAAAPILIGLGVTELSAAPATIPELKALVRRLNLARCELLARDALKQSSAEGVREVARRFQEALT